MVILATNQEDKLTPPHPDREKAISILGGRSMLAARNGKFYDSRRALPRGCGVLSTLNILYSRVKQVSTILPGVFFNCERKAARKEIRK